MQRVLFLKQLLKEWAGAAISGQLEVACAAEGCTHM